MRKNNFFLVFIAHATKGKIPGLPVFQTLNSMGHIPFLPKILAASDLVKKKVGNNRKLPGMGAHLQAAFCYCQNKDKSELH